ncbi:MAG: hypothetical protein HC788_08135 [Sphingopyxis sp.]|nr:hypothetical protein [Sphingopyxis sp.]
MLARLDGAAQVHRVHAVPGVDAAAFERSGKHFSASFLDQQDSWDSPYDVLFADPPYAALDELEVMMHSWRPGLLSEHATMIFEQDSRTELPATIDHASLLRRYVYGDTALYLYGLSTAQSTAS